VIDFAQLDARIRAVVLEVARPIYVSQRTVERVVGVPRRDFLRLARDGAFPSTKEKRLVVARTVDVLRYIETRLTLRARPANVTKIDALGRVGARRVST
jgi:hypothetical protein